MSEHNRTQTAGPHAGALAPKAHADYTSDMSACGTRANMTLKTPAALKERRG